MQIQWPGSIVKTKDYIKSAHEDSSDNQSHDILLYAYVNQYRKRNLQSNIALQHISSVYHLEIEVKVRQWLSDEAAICRSIPMRSSKLDFMVNTSINILFIVPFPIEPLQWQATYHQLLQKFYSLRLVVLED